MRLARRGLTVIELVLILVAIGLLVFFLLRLRNRDAAPPAPTADSALATPAAPTTGTATTLSLAAPLDSTAAAGDTLDVRLRAVDAGGAPVAGAALRIETEGGGRVEPATATSGANGEAAVRWTLGGEGVQTLRATLDGAPAPLVATVRVAGGAGAR